MKNMKVIVAHPAQQHSYRLATALNRNGLLQKYITTVYYKEHSFTSLFSKLLKPAYRSKAIQRRCSSLNDSQVVQFCEVEGLFKLLCMYCKPLKKFYKTVKYHTADRFAKKVARYAIKNDATMVITYDDSSPVLFEVLSKRAPHIKRVLDVSAANKLYMRTIYDKDVMLAPAFADRLLKEQSIVWDVDGIERSKRELESSQMFLVPSTFVADSLKYSGITDDQILYCPYGVDISMFNCKDYNNNNEALKFIYVGGVKELKGIYYLLEAFSRIDKSIARLIVVGKQDNNDDVAPYRDNVEFTGHIPHSEVPDVLRSSDVFVFPSLGEGMSLSVLEASACGLPLIVSENSGIAEKMVSGREGFIIPIQSVDSIVDKVMWFVENRDRIPEMGQNARKLAEEYSWEKYYETVARIL